MPLTNAEKQKRWRDKRNALAKQAEQPVREPTEGQRKAMAKAMAMTAEVIDRPRKDLAAKIEPLLKGLYAEGKKNMATMSPATVLHLTISLERLLVKHGIVPESDRIKTLDRRNAKYWASHP
jgi:hypothetical protein